MYNSAYDLYRDESNNRRNTTQNTSETDFGLGFISERSDVSNDLLDGNSPLNLTRSSQQGLLNQSRNRQPLGINGIDSAFNEAAINSQDVWQAYPVKNVNNSRNTGHYDVNVLTDPNSYRQARNMLTRQPRMLRSRRSSLLAGMNDPSLVDANEFMAFASESSQQKQQLLHANSINSRRDTSRMADILRSNEPRFDFGAHDGTSSAPAQLSPDNLSYHGSVNVTPGDEMANPLNGMNPVMKMPAMTSAFNGRSFADNGFYTESSSEYEKEDQAAFKRKKYKPKSSIPPDVSSAHYADQCAKAAISSRLPPFALSADEYNLLRSHLSYIHVTTYLNIRNGILRLWLSNPVVNVTIAEAAGCAREERYYRLAEVAYQFLIRHGYINFGCVEYTTRHHIFSFSPEERKKPRMTVVVIGAGIAGLGCARQLENLFRRYSFHFADYENIPRILVLEGRRRIGGRIYSAPLRSEGTSSLVDVGGHVVMGYGNGNPLTVLVRRQLGLPVDPIDTECLLYDEVSGELVSQEDRKRGGVLFKHLMKKISEFKNSMPRPSTVYGDEALMKAAKDPKVSGNIPRNEELLTISQLEESEELPKAYEDPGEMEHQPDDDQETKEETRFLEKNGFHVREGKIKTTIHAAPEPAGDMHPGLGQTIDGLIEQILQIADLSPEDMRILNWHIASLEYKLGTKLDNLSLGNWDSSEGHKFVGRNSLIRNGFIGLAKGLHMYPEKLDVRFKANVKVIEYGQNESHVILENGDRINCDRVVVSVPLGVLKDRAIQYIPDLPHWKADSIERLGFGVINKVILVYQKTFWDESQDLICVCRNSENSIGRGDSFTFWNCVKSSARPVVMAIFSGEAALQIANESDDDVVEKTRTVFEGILKPEEPVLVESIVTRWQTDPFCRGACSYVGREATAADMDLLARPLNHSVYFAGEATCRHFPGTVHGAYLSGLRAANEVLTSFTGEIQIPHPLIPLRHQSGNNTHRTGTPLAVQNPLKRPVSRNEVKAVFDDKFFDPMVEPDKLYESQRNFAPAEPRMSMVLRDNIKLWNEKLKIMRDERIAKDNEKMRHDLIKELGERPLKPEMSGANPFLIFQKDFWEKCKSETDAAKQKSTGDSSARATRNEVRAALGKMWRELPENDKLPYLDETKAIKEENMKVKMDFKTRLRQYDSEAEEFRRRWKEENATEPLEEEIRLIQLIEESGGKATTDRRYVKRVRKR